MQHQKMLLFYEENDIGEGNNYFEIISGEIVDHIAQNSY